MFDKAFVWSEMRVKSLSSSAYSFYLKFPKILKEYLVYVNKHRDKSYAFMFGCRSIQEVGDWRVVLIIKEPEINNFITNELTVDDTIDFFVDSEEYSCGIASRGRYMLDFNAYGEVERLIKKYTGRVVLGLSTCPPFEESVRRELYNQLGIAEPAETVYKIDTKVCKNLMPLYDGMWLKDEPHPYGLLASEQRLKDKQNELIKNELNEIRLCAAANPIYKVWAKTLLNKYFGRPMVFDGRDLRYSLEDVSNIHKLYEVAKNMKNKKENEKSKMVDKPFYPISALSIKKVIFSNPVTTVIWSDDTKTQVRKQKGDKWDMEKALAMAICKKALGNTSYFNNYFKKWLSEAKIEDPKKKKAEKKRKKEAAKLYGVMMTGTTEEFTKAVEESKKNILHTS